MSGSNKMGNGERFVDTYTFMVGGMGLGDPDHFGAACSDEDWAGNSAERPVRRRDPLRSDSDLKEATGSITTY